MGIDARRALQQTGVEIKDISRVGLAARRAPQQQGNLPISPGLLCQVVVDDERIFAPVSEELAHGAARIGRNVLQGRGGRGRCLHHDGVLHGTVLFQLAHQVHNGRGFLANGHVNALNALALLVDDGVHRDGGLACLAVADDQLALTTPDGYHGVNRLKSCLHGLADRLPADDARSHLFNGSRRAGLDRAFTIRRIAQSIHHPSQQSLAHGYLQDSARATCRVALRDMLVVPQNDCTHGVTLQVQGQAEGVARELDHLALHDVAQAVNTHNAVREGDYRSLGASLDTEVETLDLLLDQVTDFCRTELHDRTSVSSLSSSSTAASLLPSAQPALELT